jgi:hypothetical protein
LTALPRAQHSPIVPTAPHHKCAGEGAIAADRLLAFLSEHAVKVVVLLVLVGGLVAWLTSASSEGDAVRVLHARCAELQLPVRVIKIESGSDEESKLLLMVPSRQRVRLTDGQWAFCRANLAIRPR